MFVWFMCIYIYGYLEMRVTPVELEIVSISDYEDIVMKLIGDWIL